MGVAGRLGGKIPNASSIVVVNAEPYICVSLRPYLHLLRRLAVVPVSIGGLLEGSLTVRV